MPVSLERGKYRNVVNRVRTTGYSNCNKARLIYLVPVTMKEKREPHTAGVEWLAFEDLPREIGGELAVEWTAIYNGLVELGRTFPNPQDQRSESGRAPELRRHVWFYRDRKILPGKRGWYCRRLRWGRESTASRDARRTESPAVIQVGFDPKRNRSEGPQELDLRAYISGTRRTTD